MDAISHNETFLVPGLSVPTDVIRQAMEGAHAEAKIAAAHGDVPVGAVAVSIQTAEVLSARHNERELTGDPTAHAEILALRDAANRLGQWRLDDVLLVVTLEPCPMCTGAMVACRVGGLVFGAPDPLAGSCGSVYNLASDPRLNHEFPVLGGVQQVECSELLSEFFRSRR